MAAVAREFSPRPMPRLVPPRPAPKRVAPKLPETTEVDVEEILDLSDTAVCEIPPEHVPAAALPPPVPAAPLAHPGVVLLRTIGFFVAQVARDGLRGVRAYVEAHWVRASARARGGRLPTGG